MTLEEILGYIFGLYIVYLIVIQFLAYFRLQDLNKKENKNTGWIYVVWWKMLFVNEYKKDKKYTFLIWQYRIGVIILFSLVFYDLFFT
ncbi:MAG: hypothetical protein AABX63_00585 [Nanoarchaeota archaeon]